MNKLCFFVFLIIILISCNKGKKTEKKDDVKDQSTIVLIVDAKYKISHGWGHVYECGVKKVVQGKFKGKSIFLNVYATADLYNGLLTRMENYQNLKIKLEKTDKQNGPPPGFKDENGLWWKIVEIKKIDLK